MRLEKIEIIGFKSFADKAVFSFQPGITAIIGPNGCGKSNIVDALKWVLGEQSAKNMRGDRMEDVIFAGSEGRKATGMAEVTLHLAEVEGRLPPGLSGYNEISITRRLYRSGESEYFINKVPCRLKDIRDLFLDTGLEARSYSIVEQERIGQILNSKPVDRRFLIEEAAGVMKYKARRAEASQKLELASQNLLRIKDIITEVERQINSLNRQAKKAERYNRLREEIRDLELRILSIDYKGLIRELSEVNGRLERITEDIAKAKARVSEWEAGIEERKIRLLEIEKGIESLQAKLLQSEKGVGQKERDISLLRSDISSMKEREDKNNKEIGLLSIEEEGIKKQLKTIDEEGSALEEEIEEKGKGISEREDSLSTLEAEISAIEASLEEAKKTLFEKASRISDLRNRISHLETLRDAISKKEKIGNEEAKEINGELFRKEEDLKRTLENLDGLKKEMMALEDERAEVIRDIKRNERDLEIAEDLFLKKKDALTERSARLRSLKEIEVGLEALGSIQGQEGIKDLLMNKMDGITIHGLVADIIETSPQYEVAIEAALGEGLQHIVLKDHEAILKTIAQLKAENSGRGAFIPIEPRVMRSEDINLSPLDGIIGDAISFVRCRDGYQKVIEALLGDTVIVKDLSAGLKIWRENGIQKTFVTLEGDVIYPSGSVKGGSPSSNGGILKKRRETKELEEEIEILKKEFASVEEEMVRTSNALKESKRREETLSLRIEGLGKEILKIEKDIAILQGDRDRLLKRIEILRIEEVEMEKEKRDRDRELSINTESLNALQEEKELLEGEVSGLAQELNEKRDSFEDLRAELIDLKLGLATLKEKRDGMIKEKERLRSSQRKAEGRILALTEENRGINQRILRIEERIKEAEEELKAILRERIEYGDQMAKMKESQIELHNEIEALEQYLKKEREDLEAIQSEEGRIGVRKAELTVKIEHIIQSLRNNYNLSIEDLNLKPETEESKDIDGPSPLTHHASLDREKAEERVAHLKERIESLGPVNLTALEDYKDLKERFEFLMTQQIDLLQSIDSLKEAIVRIDRTTEHRLRESFRVLNERFQEVFRTLFEGGRAELILDGGDILNSGIEIVAQPPGKKLQNLSLMSGGEKALTAIALLFASFLVKPSPLCLLDEVDAPLDDTSIERFTSILKDLSERSQFVVITHNRKTMEVANLLYGITMEEPGVSKVVSVRLDRDKELIPNLIVPQRGL